MQLTNVHKAKALAQSKADGKGKKKVGKVLKVDSAKDDYGWYLYHQLHLQHARTRERANARIHSRTHADTGESTTLGPSLILAGTSRHHRVYGGRAFDHVPSGSSACSRDAQAYLAQMIAAASMSCTARRAALGATAVSARQQARTN